MPSAFLLVASLASAQNVDPALRPPKGAQVALVVFEDLQCPDCRRAAPLVAEAGRTYKIPVVRHDFPAAHAQLVVRRGHHRPLL